MADRTDYTHGHQHELHVDIDSEFLASVLAEVRTALASFSERLDRLEVRANTLENAIAHVTVLANEAQGAVLRYHDDANKPEPITTPLDLHFTPRSLSEFYLGEPESWNPATNTANPTQQPTITNTTPVGPQHVGDGGRHFSDRLDELEKRLHNVEEEVMSEAEWANSAEQRLISHHRRLERLEALPGVKEALDDAVKDERKPGGDNPAQSASW